MQIEQEQKALAPNRKLVAGWHDLVRGRGVVISGCNAAKTLAARAVHGDDLMDGIGVRTINIGTDLNAQDWVKMGNAYIGWARWEATFTTFSVTTRVDFGVDGFWDLSYTETGDTPTAAFSELRIHSPMVTQTTGIRIDNLRLETIPEPSVITLAFLGLLGLRFRRWASR